jgi:hypothetical protein
MPQDRRHSAGGGPASSARGFVALFGGAGSMHHAEPRQLPVLRFDIDRNGLRALLGAIAAGRVAAVLVLTRFVDHPSCHRLRAACRAHGIPLRLARSVGAVGAAGWASLAELLAARR